MSGTNPGVFKTAWFAKKARAAGLRCGYLFAKSGGENIDDHELRDFKKLARDYGKAKGAEIEYMLELKEMMEICNG